MHTPDRRLHLCCLLATMLLALMAPLANAQASATHHLNDRPRLVVGIMIDQMRYDLLYRYWDQYEEGGFRRLLSEGFSFDNASLDYAPPYTGPGHATAYTGAPPAEHGIIGNRWYSRADGEMVYVVFDETAEPVGTSSASGRMSPHRLLATTLADELFLHSNGRSRTVAFSMKDRGSILAAGRLGDAYWYDASSGKVISSSHYMDELPAWVDAFNARQLPDDLLSTPWNLLLPEEEYAASIADENPYEHRFSRTFPHDLPAMSRRQGPRALLTAPAGNTFTLEFARAALDGAQLGRNDHTDLLALSLSSTDYIGHAYAPASREVQDMFIRLDRELADFLRHLDDTVGLDQTLIFLSTDHGVAHNPVYLKDLGFPADFYHIREIERRLRAWLEWTYGTDLLLSFSNDQVFLDRDAITMNDLAHQQIERAVARYLLTEEEGVAGAITRTDLEQAEFLTGARRLVQNGFHGKRSGDVAVWFRPQWLPFYLDRTGTTHSSVYSYDNRIPLILFGRGVPAGRSTAPVSLSDLAPTVSVFLNMPFPSNATGTPLQDLMHGGPIHHR